MPHRGVQDDVQVLDHLADRLITLAELRGQLRGLVEDIVDGAALALEHRDQRRRDGVDLLRVQRPKQRFETTDERVEVQRRRRPRHRDEPARRQDPVGSLALASLELQIAVTDQVEIADLCGRRLIQRHRAVDLELHPRPLAAIDQAHLRDLADLHTRGADELAIPQPADVGELRRIPVSAVKAHLTEHHDDHRTEQHQHHGEDAESDEGTGDFHGLIVLSPTWRPQTYSIAYGEPVSRWLYGARLLAVSMTSSGAGHRSWVMCCQQPGAPPGPPRAFTRGRFSGHMYGLGPPPPSPANPPSPASPWVGSAKMLMRAMMVVAERGLSSSPNPDIA